MEALPHTRYLLGPETTPSVPTIIQGYDEPCPQGVTGGPGGRGPVQSRVSAHCSLLGFPSLTPTLRAARQENDPHLTDEELSGVTGVVQGREGAERTLDVMSENLGFTPLSVPLACSEPRFPHLKMPECPSSLLQDQGGDQEGRDQWVTSLRTTRIFTWPQGISPEDINYKVDK